MCIRWKWIFGLGIGGAAMLALLKKFKKHFQVKEPTYTVVQTFEGFEIREYGPQLVAETIVAGEKEAALREGFQILAKYIFGENRTNQSIEMTAPVTQKHQGARIEMTAPVSQIHDPQGWVVRFTMPEHYSLGNIPQPLDPRITLREISAAKVAARRFSGFGHFEQVEKETQELRDLLEKHHFVSSDTPIFARYNPPIMPPFLRRNEILITLTSEQNNQH